MNPFIDAGPGLHGALDMASLLPDCYAQYRPVIRDGMLFFIGRLSPKRRMSVMLGQAALYPGATVEERFTALLRSCPTLHKLGQVVARDHRLSRELRESLQTLESLPPATPMPVLKAILEREIPGLESLIIGDEPLAEASVAVVVPFSSRDGDGVFKILKPGVREILDEELGVWSEVGSYLEERCSFYGLPELDYRDTIERMRALLLNEVRLEQEQANLARAAEFYSDLPDVHIPRLLPWSTPDVTAMERIMGRKVTEVAALSPSDRKRLSNLVVESLLASPFWSERDEAVFHADPHAGNLFLTDDNRLAVLDWSLVTRMGKERRIQMMQMLLAAMTLDERRLADLISSIAEREPAGGPLGEAVSRAIRQIRQGRLPAFDWLVELLDDAVLTAGLNMSEEMVLFRKAVLTITGVIEDIFESATPDDAMIRSAFYNVMREVPERALASYASRAFASHLSNEDLFNLWASAPLTASRWWVGHMMDAMRWGTTGQ
jgi:ubiquinone biosynthesis protein